MRLIARRILERVDHLGGPFTARLRLLAREPLTEADGSVRYGPPPVLFSLGPRPDAARDGPRGLARLPPTYSEHGRLLHTETVLRGDPAWN